ncbi:Olfactory receptor 2A1/2A42 [Oryzias melastigma]|uniref:Olfactory receptor 2A1/2A42 n=1 Tax=Oryzias melastigma TaxID=30732 RepID=A0A834FT19_ORYME|nr:Olfactory receptor 2A1/2A42 [Oryzias melastigma]
MELYDVCTNIVLVLGVMTAEYDRAYTCVLFVSAGLAVISSYVGVIVAAKSASTDKALARKARHTLLLHLVQLGLSLSSTLYNPLMVKGSLTERESNGELQQMTWPPQSAGHELHLGVLGVKLAYSICIALNMIVNLTTGISPLTLVLMPLEQYVAVCYPLRHASIITVRNTAAAVIAVWAVSSFNNLTRVLLFLKFPFEKIKPTDVCANVSVLLAPLTAEYDRAYTCVLFVSAGVAVTSSYVGVIVAAKSASTDKALARKARHTLLLHLVQLGLSLSSTINNPVIIALSKLRRGPKRWNPERTNTSRTELKVRVYCLEVEDDRELLDNPKEATGRSGGDEGRDPEMVSRVCGCEAVDERMIRRWSAESVAVRQWTSG